MTRLRDLADSTDASLLGKVFESFLSDGAARLLALQRALENADAAALHKAAHAVKGASANIGARRMAEIAARLEEMGEAESLENAASSFAELEAEFGRVRSEIGVVLERKA